MNTIDDFWKRVSKSRKCWLWIGYKDRNGYGQFTIKGKHYGAHRFSYELTKRKIPKGLVIDHLCRKPACVNPRHLEAVTQKINMQRGIRATAKHCVNGHPFDKRNTRMKNSKGHRTCRKCHAIESAKRYAKKRNPWAVKNSLKTHCKRGHELKGKNLKPRKDGRRVCAMCCIYHSLKRSKTHRSPFYKLEVCPATA